MDDDSWLSEVPLPRVNPYDLCHKDSRCDSHVALDWRPWQGPGLEGRGSSALVSRTCLEGLSQTHDLYF